MFRNFLYPFSFIYGSLAFLRRFLYEKNILKKRQLPKKVISVGNLSVGGSGKTPLTIEIAQYLKSKGLNPVILSRGYKRKSKEPILFCDENKNWKACGDEPFLMVKKGLKVVVGKDRYKSGLEYLKKYPVDVFILDDGFQHFQLHRDLNILVIDATKPFWEDRLLPAGNLREPKSFYKFADCFVVNRFNQVKEKEEFLSILKTYNKPFFITQESFQHLIDTQGNYKELSYLKGKSVIVFSGLGNNKQFFVALEELSKEYGFFIERFISLPDHYDYEDFKVDMDKTYLTTEKDIIKLPKFKNVLALSYNLTLPKEFYNFMEEKLWKQKTH